MMLPIIVGRRLRYISVDSVSLWINTMKYHCLFLVALLAASADAQNSVVPATLLQPATSAAAQPAATVAPGPALPQATSTPTSTNSTQAKAEAKKPEKADAEKVMDVSEEELKNALAAEPSPPAPEDPAEKAKREAAEKQKQQKRIALVRKLQFDRRSSTALKLWSSAKKNESEEADNDSEEKKAEPTEEQLFAESLETLKRNVTQGNWPEVKSFLADLNEDLAKVAYQQLLTSLTRGPSAKPIPPNANGFVDPAAMAAAMNSRRAGAQFKEKNFFSLNDIFSLVDIAPHKLEKQQLQLLGQLLNQTLTLGHELEAFLDRLKKECSQENDPILTKRQAALLLFFSGKQIEMGEFLPTPEEARKANDREGLNMISKFAMAKYNQEKETKYLEQAWAATQAALATGDVEEEEKNEALKRAVELAPKIKEQFGQAWLDESFTDRIERGKEVLATIGAGTATAMQMRPTDPQARLRGIQLQKTAVEALLSAAPERAQEWREQLVLLANNWLDEAEFSYQRSQASSMRPQLQRDAFGNYFYASGSQFSNSRSTSNRGARPIPTPDILETRPNDKWLTLLDDSMRPRFAYIFAQLFLKVNEEEKAFPYIEQFAKNRPTKARDLAHEFLRVWTNNHDPNANRNRTNYYMFAFGYNRRADHIPLTRSKQQRNLKELAEWIGRIRAIPIEDIDEQLLVRAFTTSHSRAEVYRVEAMEQVFGSIDNLEPKTLAEMIQNMRANLIGIWRNPATQKNANTKRKKADIQSEVVRGYEVAKEVMDRALSKSPDDWRLNLAKASIMHDENDYRQSLQKSSEFSAKRREALDLFARAAQLYAETLDEIKEDEETSQPYELWYYASLGAVDLGQITEKSVPDLKQPALIREAIERLPGETSERHMSKFANSLFTRMSSLKPEMKFRYLRTGFEIVGDHKQAQEARKVFDYYQDLVTEIQLQTVIDGSSDIPHSGSFGVWVNLLHTKEIERESGGFSKYLQNQNNMYYAYNYGRPTENYRDKFQETATQALDEHFEVLSVTFNDPQTKSNAVPGKFGWRVTPYAYLLLKPRGPEVDKVPSLRMDLDFLDTSGYAIIPVESAAIPIDATKEKGESRPFENLKVVQTLDERQAAEGKLVLEIKATSNGLVPNLDEITEIAPKDFDVTNVEDQGLSVSRFDQESTGTAVLSERLWMVTLEAKEDLAKTPEEFTFPVAKLSDIEFTHQRYVDADLEDVQGTITLEASYGEPRVIWPWVVGGSIGLIVLLSGAIWTLSKQPQVTTDSATVQLPSDITPFTVLGLLREIQHNNGFSTQKKNELAESINRLERNYFVQSGSDEIDLHKLAETWIRQSGIKH